MSQLAASHGRQRAWRFLTVFFFGAASAHAQAGVDRRDTLAMQPYLQKVPGTLVSLEMLPVPAASVQPSAAKRAEPVAVGPFWVSQTEVTWDLYDIYVFGLDRSDSGAAGGAAAVSRPTKPYVLPGEQFGHAGHPALAMTFHGAESFARWLSAKTGKTYRLPTEAEWELACRLGKTDTPEPVALAERAWYGDNAEDRTHAVRTLVANALGVHDMLGNVAEWVSGADGEPVVKGGAFLDDAGHVSCSARQKQTPAWNATDPQLPKSRWWLADAPFVGIRLVRQP